MQDVFSKYVYLFHFEFSIIPQWISTRIHWLLEDYVTSFSEEVYSSDEMIKLWKAEGDNISKKIWHQCFARMQ